MSHSVWKDSFDRIEEQLDVVSLSLVRGESTDLTHSAHLLELMCKELLAWAQQPAQNRESWSIELTGRARLLHGRLLDMRQSLLQRGAFAEKALQVLVPSAVGDASTYMNVRQSLPKTPYSSGLRTSGTFSVVRA